MQQAYVTPNNLSVAVPIPTDINAQGVPQDYLFQQPEPPKDWFKPAPLTQIEITRAKLQADFMLFVRTFYPLISGVPFVISDPPGRESHYITCIRQLNRVFYGEINRLIINLPPRYGKTTLIVFWVAWCFCRYPDCNFIYASYVKSLATEQTQLIRRIISSRHFYAIFGFRVASDSSAKDDFKTEYPTDDFGPGHCMSVGVGGAIVGFGAGIQSANRFGGAALIDDPISPVDATSETVRQTTKDWFHSSLKTRLNNPNQTPIILFCQRTHEDDLSAHLIEQGGWELLSIPAIDDRGNALDPSKHSIDALRELERQSKYHFWAQMMQKPQPAGGGLFQRSEFKLLNREPEVAMTFISVDSAETESSYNDATVFSFWGLYKVKIGGFDTGQWALHWIDCLEIRVEPKDLESEFLTFYADCLKHPVKCSASVIEKKSSGVTLVSTLKRVPGLRVIALDRPSTGGSKTKRFIDCQKFIANGLISLPERGRHTELCLSHMSKITANDTHRHDDIADTLQSAIQVTLIEGSLMPEIDDKSDEVMRNLMGDFNRATYLRRAAL